MQSENNAGLLQRLVDWVFPKSCKRELQRASLENKVICHELFCLIRDNREVLAKKVGYEHEKHSA